MKFKFKIRNCKIQNLNLQVDKDDKDTIDLAISLSSVKMNELEISQNIEKILKTNTSLPFSPKLMRTTLENAAANYSHESQCRCECHKNKNIIWKTFSIYFLLFSRWKYLINKYFDVKLKSFDCLHIKCIYFYKVSPIFWQDFQETTSDSSFLHGVQ